MAALLDIGSGTVADVCRIVDQREEGVSAYSTILTQLRALRRKGWLTSTRHGRADYYTPARDWLRPFPWYAAQFQKSLRLYNSDDELLLDVAARGRLTRQAMHRACRVLERRLGRAIAA